MKFNKENKETLTKFTPENLPNEALGFIIKWTSTNLEYYKQESESNFIYAKEKDKEYWYSIGWLRGCKSTHFGDTNHVKTIYKLN